MKGNKKKTFNFVAVFVVAIFVLLSTKQIHSAGSDYAILVYGTSNCGYCKILKRDLKTNYISYDFIDVRRNRAKQREMWQHIRRVYPGKRRVGYPVVFIEGKVLIRPTVAEVIENSSLYEPKGGDIVCESGKKSRGGDGSGKPISRNMSPNKSESVVAGNDTSWNLVYIDTARNKSYLTRIEKDIILLINKARNNPPLFARTYLKKRKADDGFARECYKQMLSMQPVEVLQPSRVLYNSARDFAIYQGRKGQPGYSGAGGSNVLSRVKRYGQWHGSLSENCYLGKSDPLQIVVKLLVDHGVAGRLHRENILSTRSRFVGVSVQPYGEGRFICVQDFSERITKR